MRQEADRRFLGIGPTFATLDDPLQYAQVFAEARPQEFAVVVLAEPVDVENLGQVLGALGEGQPVCPVVGEVVATERLHRHRVAAHDADFADHGGRGLRCGAGTDQYAVFPALCLVDERGNLLAAAAEYDR